ncbi:MAG: CocE/NonD family hydrolase [Anaerolineae bacterium]|nr:CocE/NonD family hydrolase [Anaerolineae bacterium]
MNKRIAFSISTVAAAGAGLYALRRQVIARALALPPVTTDVTVERGVPISMPDGTVLVADHYRPKSSAPLPTILIRTPYDRTGFAGIVRGFVPQRFAERGYHVIVQDVRGCFDSEGEFEPYFHEAGDGNATINWIAAQPWSDGAVGMWGPSYLGFVQWAAVSAENPHLKAIFPIITRSQLGGLSEHGFELDLIMRWVLLLDTMHNDRLPAWERLARQAWPARQNKLLGPAFDHLPLHEAASVALDQPPAFYQKWVENGNIDNDYWQKVDFRHAVPNAPPAHFVGGWYDFFITDLLDDYAMQRDAGLNPFLTVGPWPHAGTESQMQVLDQALHWFDAHLRGQPDALRSHAVRIHVMGVDEWIDLDVWPPSAEDHYLYLRGKGLYSGGLLTEEMPGQNESPDRYVYDPHEPTPNVGGPLISLDAGARDNRELEARHDVLTYTTEPLLAPFELIGTARLVLYVRTSAVSTDFFGRICDVHPDGRSLNICDGLFRYQPERGERQPDGSVRLVFELSATAHCFLPGHCIRLQVSSGAHPRLARNLGTGESFIYGTRMVVQHQTVYHDADHPAALILPRTHLLP